MRAVPTDMLCVAAELREIGDHEERFAGLGTCAGEHCIPLCKECLAFAWFWFVVVCAGCFDWIAEAFLVERFDVAGRVLQVLLDLLFLLGFGAIMKPTFVANGTCAHFNAIENTMPLSHQIVKIVVCAAIEFFLFVDRAIFVDRMTSLTEWCEQVQNAPDFFIFDIVRTLSDQVGDFLAVFGKLVLVESRVFLEVFERLRGASLLLSEQVNVLLIVAFAFLSTIFIFVVAMASTIIDELLFFTLVRKVRSTFSHALSRCLGNDFVIC